MRFTLIAIALVALGTLPAKGAAQTSPRLLFTVGANDDVALTDVRAAVRMAGRSIVLSAPAPAIHSRSDAGDIRSWGRDGDGPGEFRVPIDLTWSPSGGLVRPERASHHRV